MWRAAETVTRKLFFLERLAQKINLRSKKYISVTGPSSVSFSFRFQPSARLNEMCTASDVYSIGTPRMKLYTNKRHSGTPELIELRSFWLEQALSAISRP